jgi:peptidylprolyl isomerase
MRRVLMKKAKSGDTVKVHYTGQTEEETIFGSSKEDQPVEFKIGSGAVISGLEKGVIGMTVGDIKTITVPPEDAFGPVREELFSTINKRDFPDVVEPAKGQRLKVIEKNGSVSYGTIVDIQEDVVTLDENHALAGKTVKFDIELVDILR